MLCKTLFAKRFAKVNIYNVYLNHHRTTYKMRMVKIRNFDQEKHAKYHLIVVKYFQDSSVDSLLVLCSINECWSTVWIYEGR